MEHIVKFNNTEITAVKEDDEIFVPIKPICEAIGIDYDAQIERIKTDDVLSELTSLRGVVAADGKRREMICLPLEHLHGWLFSIETNRVNEAARPALKIYKLECHQVLHNYFFGKPSETAKRAALIMQYKNKIKSHQNSINALKKQIEKLEGMQGFLPFNQEE